MGVQSRCAACPPRKDIRDPAGEQVPRENIQHLIVPNAAHSGLWASRVAARLVRPMGMPEICPMSELLGQISDIPMGC